MESLRLNVDLNSCAKCPHHQEVMWGCLIHSLDFAFV